MRSLALLAYLASACTIPDAKWDSLECRNDPAPTTVPSTVTIAGVLKDPYMGASVADAMVRVIRNSDGSDLDIDFSTDASGNFSFVMSTGNPPAPLAVHLEITGSAGSDDTDPPIPISYWPAVSIGADLTNIQTQIYTYGELAAIGGVIGVPLGSDTVQVFVSVVDCVDAQVPGATIVTEGTTYYIHNMQPDPTATATDGVTGAALVIGQGSGSSVSVGATLGDITFDRHVVTVPPGTVGEAEVAP